VEYKNPIEEEWEKFQKEMKEETTVSAQIIAEDQEEATAERQIDEIDEQMRNWSRLRNDFVLGNITVPPRELMKTVKNNEECRLVECEAIWLVLQPTFWGNCYQLLVTAKVLSSLIPSTVMVKVTHTPEWSVPNKNKLRGF
jgi:hypothetical protein